MKASERRRTDEAGGKRRAARAHGSPTSARDWTCVEDLAIISEIGEAEDFALAGAVLPL